MTATVNFLYTSHIKLTCFHVTGRPKVLLPSASLTAFFAYSGSLLLFWQVIMDFYIYFHIFRSSGWKLFLCIAVLSSPMAMRSKWPPSLSFLFLFLLSSFCQRCKEGWGERGSRVFTNNSYENKDPCGKIPHISRAFTSIVLSQRK